MDRNKLEYRDTDPWTWSRAIHTDVEEICNLVEMFYKPEIAGILVPNRTRMTYHLHQAILNQTYVPRSECLTVARDRTTNALVAWAWVNRGKFTQYADEEMAVAEFLHIDLTLPVRQRMRLTGQAFDMWITWCTEANIPVLCSTSIRDEQAGFMRLHDAYGFVRHGSFAYRRII